MAEWIDYRALKPPRAGVFQWRLPSIAVPGMSVTFYAHMRERGAGYSDVLSPVFDYWDGYRVHVPAGTQWRDTDEHQSIPSYEYAGLAAEGVEHIACPFCGAVPRLRAVQGHSGGVVINGDPHKYNRWWLDCCSWGKTPHLGDPREIERIRRAAFAGLPAQGGGNG